MLERSQQHRTRYTASLKNHRIPDGQQRTDPDNQESHMNSLAAEQGFALAQFIVGVMYEHGLCVTKSEKEAVRWYHIAAEQGLAPWRRVEIGQTALARPRSEDQ